MANENEGRNEKGKFSKGWKGGPGNPWAAKVNQLRKTLFDCISTADWTEIIDKTVQDAKSGDKTAREFLASYVLGKPTQIIEASVETTTVSAEEVRARIDEILGISEVNEGK